MGCSRLMRCASCSRTSGWRLNGQPWWVRAFKTVGFLGSSPPSEPMTLYRGALPDYRKAMSWTTDIDRARWFARRISLVRDPILGHLYRAEVPAHHIWAAWQENPEHEVVVNPWALRNLVEDLAEVPPPGRVAAPPSDGSAS